MTTLQRSLFAVAALLAAAPARAADPTGPEVLAKVDYALNCFKDAVFESKLLVKDPSGSSREYIFTTFQKSPDKRRVIFRSPGDVKGMGVLIENAETMYVFLPGFQKVRRMGTHIRNQTFMGSDFSFEDMSQTKFAETFDAKLVGQDAGNWIVELRLKPGKEAEFPVVKLWSDKKMFQPTRMEYFDESGKNLKSQLRLDYKPDSPVHFQPYHIIITDHRRNDHVSEIIFSSTKIDSGLTDEVFSVRSLIRGN
jgi:outer membrane lipoprotein-sorting protein